MKYAPHCPMWLVVWDCACMMYGQEWVAPMCQFKRNLEEVLE